MQKKQAFLRKEILDKQYDPQEFIEFLDSKLKIGDDLTLCTFEQLKSVVEIFLCLHEQESESPQQQPVEQVEEAKSIQPIQNESVILGTSTVKPKTILFVLLRLPRKSTTSPSLSSPRPSNVSRSTRSSKARSCIAASVSNHFTIQSAKKKHGWILRHWSYLFPLILSGYA